MKQKIVLVEDDEAVSDILTIILQSNDFEVINFSSAEQLLTEGVEDVNLFLIDYTLPGIDGVHLCRHLKQEKITQSVPIILISADFHIRLKSSECGADAAVDKPFSRLELLTIINKLIRPTVN